MSRDGPPKTVTVRARRRLNPTGLIVQAGDGLKVRARGDWVDLFRRTCADGYKTPWLWPFKRFRRVPTAPWFSLCGAVGEDDRCVFHLGATSAVMINRTGPLYLFANDMPLMYWNNSQALDVEIQVMPGGLPPASEVGGPRRVQGRTGLGCLD